MRIFKKQGFKLPYLGKEAFKDLTRMGLDYEQGIFLIRDLNNVENIMDFVFYSSMLMQSVVGFTACFFIVNVLEMIGLIVLLWVTWK